MVYQFQTGPDTPLVESKFILVEGNQERLTLRQACLPDKQAQSERDPERVIPN